MVYLDILGISCWDHGYNCYMLLFLQQSLGFDYQLFNFSFLRVITSTEGICHSEDGCISIFEVKTVFLAEM